ncbi:MAG: radical SAM protein [archaeon]
MNVLRKTHSLCPVCLRKISADVVETSGTVKMVKSCSDHGDFSVMLSSHPGDYRAMHDSYFSYPGKGPGPDLYQLMLTLDCNISCRECFVRANYHKYREPSLREIRQLLAGFRGKKIGLFGGEPTIREDLADIIRIVRESGNAALLHTNGIRLAQKPYVEMLKKSGVSEVHLQFDGFDRDYYIGRRGADLLDSKLLALRNLRGCRMPTVIEATVDENNIGETPGILRYALNNRFVKAVVFRPVAHMKMPGGLMCVEDIMDELCRSTGGRVSTGRVYRSQPLLYLLSHIFGRKKCFYNLYYPLFRGKRVRTLADFVDLRRLAAIPGNARIISWMRLITAMRWRSLLLLPSLFRLAYSGPLTFTKAGGAGCMILAFAVICDPARIDYQVMSCCNQGEISTDYGISRATALVNVRRYHSK